MAVVISDSANPKYGTAVATIAINAIGEDYEVDDVLTLTGGDANATVTVTSIDGDGGITGISRTSVGSGYSAGTEAVAGGAGTGATIDITVQAGLGTVEGFYRVEAHNLGSYYSVGGHPVLSTTRTINITFANAGDCQGVVLALYAPDINHTKPVTVELKEGATTRATSTLTAAEITNGIAKTRGEWVVPFVFSSPYAVTTASSTWTIVVSQGAGDRDWRIISSDGTNPFYAIWCNNQVSFTNDDAVIFKDKVIIDRSADFKAQSLPTGWTTASACAYLCTSPDPSINNVARMEWENPPLASYKVTLDGYMCVAPHSGIRIGSDANPIPIAQKAVIEVKPTSFGTSTNAGIVDITSPLNLTGGYTRMYGKGSILMYAEHPAKLWTTLTAAAARNQKVINVTDASFLQAGDRVVLGLRDQAGGQDGTIYTIDSIAGNQVTLTGNIATYAVGEGAHCGLLRDSGIVLQSSDTTVRQMWVRLPSRYIMRGVSTNYFTFGAGDYYNHGISQDDMANIEKLSVSYCSVNGGIGSGSIASTEKGMEFHHNMIFRTLTRMWASTSSFGLTPNSAAEMYENLFVMGFGGYSLNIVANSKFIVRNNIWEQRPSSSNLVLAGASLDFYDNIYRGAFEGIHLGTSSQGLIFSDETIWQNNSFSLNRWHFQMKNDCVNLKFKNDTYADNVTFHGIELASSRLGDIEFYNCSGQMTVDTVGTTGPGLAPISEMAPSSKIRFVNHNKESHKDFILMPFGTTTRTGDGLADTTVRTEGADKYAIRFESTSSLNNLSWTHLVPTGDITAKTMSVNVWCKINSADYYSGTHQKPRLTVDYDNGTEVYAEAVVGTGWQLLAVSFTPTSEYGQIKVTLSTRTDQTGSSAYVYFDDVGVLYPAGHTLNLGGLDLWANAFPVVPAISTLASAQDVWAVPTSQLTGAGTVGKQVGDIKKDTGLIPATL